MLSFDDLPWDEIREISKEGLFKGRFGKIDKSTFRFAAQEENRPALIESALKSLRKTNPNAPPGQATLLADIMQTFAQKIIKG